MQDDDRGRVEEGKAPAPWSPKTAKRRTAARKGATTKRKKAAG